MRDNVVYLHNTALRILYLQYSYCRLGAKGPPPDYLTATGYTPGACIGFLLPGGDMHLLMSLRTLYNIWYSTN